MSRIRQGSCNCGAVRLSARGEPLRVGLCHCAVCRKETGSAFMAFAVWDRGMVSITGATQSWIGRTDHRHFCGVCGAHLFATHDDDAEVEIRLGCLDDVPCGLVPQYEVWAHRREPWLPPVADAAQHTGNRP